MRLQSIGRRGVLVGASGLLAAPSIVRAQGRNGVALVIGNSKYRWESSLPNAKRDVADVAKRFQLMGFKTQLIENADRDGMIAAINDYRTASLGASFSAFYFAGHGVTWNNVTYLVPADADLSDPKSVDRLVKVDAVQSAARLAPYLLLALDACRNNPAEGWRQRAAEESALFVSSGGASVGVDMTVIYSTAPGYVALDGPAGQNSPFATAFLRQLEGDKIDVRALPSRLRRDLIIATQGRQMVFFSSGFRTVYALTGPGRAVPPSGPIGDASRIVEASKAYAFAKENNIPLPVGLVSYRQSANPSDSRKVGSFKFDSKGGGSLYPEVVIVLSADETGAAKLVIGGPKPERGQAYWRFVAGRHKGDRLEFLPHTRTARYTFDWRDDNSGGVGMIWENDVNASTRPFSSRFYRLDG